MRRILLASTVLALMATPVLADRPGRDWLDRAQVTQILKEQGYQVMKLEADDHHWEGEAVKDGQRFDFHVDPHTGNITKLERDD
ncbi:MAG TPA: PepSY domain-containing protein [Sphingomonadaceae bacterium]|nr:PepSY domain-containing protein [Sphingomonadaceae bacterium]